MHAMMGDPAALRGFYLGDETIYDPRNWRPWLGPGLLWASFICTTQLMCLAVNVLMRRQWTRNERLSFPLVVLPIEMTDISRTGIRCPNHHTITSPSVVRRSNVK